MSESFLTRIPGAAPDAIAPDGSEVRLLASLGAGSMAQFRLQPGTVSKAVAHRTVDELWIVTKGHGRMWRKDQTREEVTELISGVSLSIPLGTAFQFRCDGTEVLECVGVTMPPWPGPDEAYDVKGAW